MSSKKLIALFALLRPFNLIIVSVVVFAASVLAGGEASEWKRIVLAALAAASIAAGGYAINDYFDVEIDRVNRPGRPIPRGDVTPTEAWWSWRLSSSLGVIISAFLGPLPLVVSLVWVVSLYFYSSSLKRKVLVGNLVVSVATGLAFVYGAAVAGIVDRAFMPALFAFLVNIAREIVKDVEDIDGDSKSNAKTLPIRYGINAARIGVSLALIILVGMTLAAYRWGLYSLRYLSIISVVDIVLIAVVISLWYNVSNTNLRRLSTILKISMLVGLAALYFGSFA